MNLIRALAVFVLPLVMAATVSAQDAKQSPASPHFDVTPLITGGLLDSSTPIEHRRELAKRLIEAADREKSPVLLYYVGSLYRQGDWAGIAPFPKDLDRAREYLTRAALGGFINAMSKMAVVELDSGNQFEANLWAQLYSYYSAINDPAKPAASHGYQRPTSRESLSSALLALTTDGFPDSEVPKLIERANAMVARYDATIRAEMARHKAENEKQRAEFPNKSPGHAKHITPLQLRNQLGRKAASAQAEFFVEISPVGKLLRVWPFDGWPEQNVLRVLRPMVDGIPLSPAPEGTTENRVVLIPVVFANPTYRLKQDGDKK